MRIVWVLLAVIGLTGCRHPAAPQDQASDPKRQVQPAPNRGTAQKQPPVKSAPKLPKIIPATGITGRVAAVNEKLRFVVVDFYLSQMPQTEQRLGVYRQGQKVGEIKISPYQTAQNVAADIVAGEARVGDEVRLD